MLFLLLYGVIFVGGWFATKVECSFFFFFWDATGNGLEKKGYGRMFASIMNIGSFNGL